jgi:hypothetical protein
MKIKLLAALVGTVLIATLSLCSCNQVTKMYGGSMNVELEKDQKLINVSWKQDSLWMLTRSRRADEPIEKYKYEENSAFGLLQGTVTIIEK